MSPDSAIFSFFSFYQYNFVVGLLQGFIINAHETGSNSLGAGTFSRDLAKTKSLQCRDFTRALHMEKSISLLFPCPCWDVVANDWCINPIAIKSLKSDYCQKLDTKMSGSRFFYNKYTSKVT